MKGAARVHWWIEEVSPGARLLGDAARAAGARVSAWDDAWWSSRRFPAEAEEAVVFHGSLGNADRIRRELPWRPGAFCDAAAFEYGRWAPAVRRWLVNEAWVATTAAALAADPRGVAAQAGAGAAIFVRPSSALKPFAGRVLAVSAVSLAALDHGFYYEDAQTGVIVAPVRRIGQEWRLVIAGGEVVCASGYVAEGRRALEVAAPEAVVRFAAAVVGSLPPLDPIFVMDVAEVEGALRLMEVNPFSGADLYGCDRRAVVAAVHALIEGGEGP